MPRFTTPAVLLSILTVALAPGLAQGDTLHITDLHWSDESGAFQLTATATAPHNSDYAIALTLQPCPPAPSESDTYTELGPEPAHLQAAPGPEETGPAHVCVWIFRYDHSTSARFTAPVTIPASAKAPNPAAVLANNHPAWWIPVGGGALLLLLAIVALIAFTPIGLTGLLVLVLRRRRRNRSEQADEHERIDDIRDEADSDSNPDTAQADTTETPAPDTTEMTAQDTTEMLPDDTADLPERDEHPERGSVPEPAAPRLADGQLDPADGADRDVGEHADPLATEGASPTGETPAEDGES